MGRLSSLASSESGGESTSGAACVSIGQLKVVLIIDGSEGLQSAAVWLLAAHAL